MPNDKVKMPLVLFCFIITSVFGLTININSKNNQIACENQALKPHT